MDNLSCGDRLIKNPILTTSRALSVTILVIMSLSACQHNMASKSTSTVLSPQPTQTSPQNQSHTQPHVLPSRCQPATPLTAAQQQLLDQQALAYQYLAGCITEYLNDHCEYQCQAEQCRRQPENYLGFTLWQAIYQDCRAQ
ncbi:hypothetical protein [Shewanella sp. NFH-SH190041]|uniref:hypothetical protein n=1 Tax=Shewanella sp. NFH-SH190041 TaxID=2950245 RepID=UPI0021C3C03D|nr:hypothetical protein [Shewanella sp. NFH-SH190041]